MTKNNFLLLLGMLLPSIIYACHCNVSPNSFCGSIGDDWRSGDIVLAEMIDYHDFQRIPGERNLPYARVKVIEDLTQGISADTIRIYYEDGISCNTSVFIEPGDSALFNLEPHIYSNEPHHYQVTFCGVNYLFLVNDTLRWSIREGVNKLSYDDFLDQFEECYALPPYVNIFSSVKYTKDQTTANQFNFSINETLHQTDDYGRFIFRLLYHNQWQVDSMAFKTNELDYEGITTADIVRIRRHLLGHEEFTEAWQYIAADINNSASVSTIDLVILSRLILGIEAELPEKRSLVILPDKEWIFHDSDPFNRRYPRDFFWIQFFQSNAPGYYRLWLVKLGDLV